MKLGIEHSRNWRILAVGVVLFILCGPSLLSAEDSAVKQLKDRVANAKVVDRPPLCLQIAERQLATVNKLFDAGDLEQAKTALTDVVSFSELARDYSIQTHKHEKQSEITIRRMTRKLADLKHAVTHEEQQQVQTTIERLDRIRDDLLVAMFPKVGKK